MSKSVRFFAAFAFMLAIVVGPRPTLGQSPTAVTPAITISPTSATVVVSAATTFTAKVTGVTGAKLVWTVNGIALGNVNVGTVDPYGHFAAPAVMPTGDFVTVGVHLSTNPAVQASARVNLRNTIARVGTITQASVNAGALFSVILEGTGFAKGAVVKFGTQAVTTTFVTGNKLVASGTVTTPGTYGVTVTNPAPGGGVSAAVTEEVLSATPAVSLNAAVRFLEQSSFGPTPQSIAHLQQVGFQAYLNEQFTATYRPFVLPPDGNVQTLKAQYYVNALTSPAQLRMRMALALQEICVVSANKVTDLNGLVGWQNLMLNNALGNYGNFLRNVTISPAMGKYLDSANNNKTDPTSGVDPNENLAREVMQLFSIGLYKLNADGTMQLDGSGQPINTYDQDTIEGFARVFTGYTYPTQPGHTAEPNNPEYYVGNMIPFDVEHDETAKPVLNGTVLPAGQSTVLDMSEGLTSIINNPNVGPFIGKQLIQHLVKSNPSPAYVSRITAVFNNNGAGVRGDLKAVVTAILLDPEARAGDKLTITASDGHLQEPVLYMVGLLRRLNGVSDGKALVDWGAAMGEDILEPPTVFNFFPPNYFLDDTGVIGPEFAIQNSATFQMRANFVNSLIIWNSVQNTTVDLIQFNTNGNATSQLAQLNFRFLHGSMPSEMTSTILSAVNTIPSGQADFRARQAIYLIATSGEYQVLH